MRWIWLPLILLTAVHAQPPSPPGFTPVLSPKQKELKESWGTPMIKVSYSPGIPIPMTGFAITNLSVANNQVSLSWINGVPPFQVIGEPTLYGPWNEVGNITTARSKVFPEDINHFFTVQGSIVMPLEATRTNNLTRLTWEAPDTDMSDSLQAFTLKRSTDGGATFPNTVAVVQPGGTYSVDDSTPIPAGGSLTWELLEQTLNGVVVPYSKPVASNVAGGSIVWAGTSGQVGSTLLYQTAIDPSGNIWAAGSSTSSTAQLEVYKFRPDGSLSIPVLIYPSVGSSICVARAITTDSLGNVFIAGWYTIQIDFGNGHLLLGTDATTPNAFIAKISPTGTCLMAKKFGSNVSGSLVDPTFSVFSIATTHDGFVIIGGVYYGPADFGNGWLLAGNQKAFVAKIDATTGDTAWAFTMCSDVRSVVRCVTVDANNNVLVGGWALSSNFPIDTADFKGVSGPSTSVNLSPYIDIFLAKYNSSGVLLSKLDSTPWVKIIQASSYVNPPQSAFSVAVDTVGDIILAGAFHGTVDFGGGSITSSNSFDAFLVKYNSDGGYIWGRYPNTGQPNYPRVYPGVCSMSIDPQNNIVIAGSYQSATMFLDRTPTSAGSNSLNKAGLSSAYVAKFKPDGTFVWAHSADNTDFLNGISVACNSTSVALLGQFPTSATNPTRTTPLTMWNAANRFSGGTPYPSPQVGTVLNGYVLLGTLNSDIFLFLVSP